MRKIFGIGFLCVLSFVKAQTWETNDQYIQRFAMYAVEEMEKYKIPASIKLAQGILETGGGQSRLAKEGKNHFGIKCKEEWTGKSMKHTDDAPNECFRVYEDPKQSYEDHSLFLAKRKFYVGLFKLNPKDYKAWAHGLKKAGYATNPKYASILIDRIERYKLYEFDHISKDEVYATLVKRYPELVNDEVFLAQMGKETTKTKVDLASVVHNTPVKEKIKEEKLVKEKSREELLRSILIKNHPNGDLKFLVMPVDANISVIAKRYGIIESKLIKYNELQSSKLNKNDIVFLESKRSFGNKNTYQAEAGESMYDISQKFGVKLAQLYKKNRMQVGEQPKAGQIIYLQSKKPKA